MKIWSKIVKVFIVVGLIPCFLLCGCKSVSTSSKSISPPINIQGDFKWKYVDTQFCRIYFYQDDDAVSSKAKEIDGIYKGICDKFKHSSKGDSKENNKIVITFLDDETYKNYTGDATAGAQWRDSGGLINLNKINSNNVNGTIRHELIHAVTLRSEDSKIKNYPSWFAEGIAQYYQPDIEKGLFQQSLIKDAVAKKGIEPWSTMISESGKWDNRALKYTEAACIYDFLIKKYGEDKIVNIFYTDGDFNEVIQGVTSKSVYELEKEWNQYILSTI